MGNYRIIINAVGNHGQDRAKRHGEEVDFGASGSHSPDGEAAEFVAQLKAMGENVQEATIMHWPGTDNAVIDNLLTGKRIGQF
jgi:hypothetical protein